jgi:outer membrane protein
MSSFVRGFRVLALGLVAAGYAAVTEAAYAEDGLGAGDWLFRVRGLAVVPDEKGHDDQLNGSIALGNSYVPEVDMTYFFTDYVSAELIAATTRHSVKDKGSAAGDLNLGHVWLLPPTLTAQVHPLGRSRFDPYLGAGVNYTIFYGSGGTQDIGGQKAKVNYDNRFGYAFQAGVNYQIDDSWFLNLDVKKLYLSTSAHVVVEGTGEATRASVDIDPWLVAVGIGYRF